MRYRFMSLGAALVLALGLGAIPAQAAPLAVPAAGGVVADNLRTAPIKAAKGSLVAPPNKFPGDASRQANRLLVACGSACHHYNVAQDDTNTNSPVPQGVVANFSIQACNVDTADGGIFSLGQIAVREITSGTHYVEAGWACNPSIFGDTNPHFFASIWLNGNWCGSWTGSGTCTGIPYIDNASNSFNLGASVAGAIGTSKAIKVQYFNGDWWVYYDSMANWVGRFQGGQVGGWPATFDQARLVQLFGETATTQDPLSTDCTDMGNGTLGDDSPAAGAQVGSATYLDGTGAGLPTAGVNLAGSQLSDPGTYPGASAYNIAMQSLRTFRYGGPGVC